MAQMVTIEGSVTPSSELPKGERRTVVYTDRIKRLVSKGFIVITDGPHDSDTPLAPIPAENQAPPPPGPHTYEGTGEPNTGVELPADGQAHDVSVTPEAVSAPAPQWQVDAPSSLVENPEPQETIA